MSDTLIIDTGQNVTKEVVIEPLPLFDENHPMLRKPIPEYTGVLPNENMTNLVRRLKMTMKLYSGLGLSANQCGVFERVFVIGTDDFQLECINPKVIEQGPIETVDPKENYKEGCLSFPGLFLNVSRPSWILAEFLNVKGELQQMRLYGVTARCFLHELDHMNGIRFIEHVKPLALKMARQKQEKFIKKIVRKNKKK